MCRRKGQWLRSSVRLELGEEPLWEALRVVLIHTGLIDFLRGNFTCLLSQQFLERKPKKSKITNVAAWHLIPLHRPALRCPLKTAGTSELFPFHVSPNAFPLCHTSEHASVCTVSCICRQQGRGNQSVTVQKTRQSKVCLCFLKAVISPCCFTLEA